MGAPTTTLTSPNNFNFVDDRSSDPLHIGVRQLEFSEVLKISGFDDDLNAAVFLNSRSEENALKTVASAIPPPALFHLYRASVRHAISVIVSLHEVNGLEETFAIDLSPERDLPPCDDDDFALFAADVVTQSPIAPLMFNRARSKCSLVRLMCAQNNRLVKCLLLRGLLCIFMALKPGVARWLSYGGTKAFGTIPKNAWSNTLLGVTLIITVSNVVTHVILSGAAIGVLLLVWIVSCVLTRRSH